MRERLTIVDVKVRRDGRVVLRRNAAWKTQIGVWSARLGNDAIIGEVRPSLRSPWEWSRGDGAWRSGYRYQADAIAALLALVNGGEKADASEYQWEPIGGWSPSCGHGRFVRTSEFEVFCTDCEMSYPITHIRRARGEPAGS